MFSCQHGGRAGGQLGGDELEAQRAVAGDRVDADAVLAVQRGGALALVGDFFNAEDRRTLDSALAI